MTETSSVPSSPLAERLWLVIIFTAVGLGVVSLIVMAAFAFTWQREVTMTLNVHTGQLIEIERGHFRWQPLPETFRVMDSRPTVFSEVFALSSSEQGEVPESPLALRMPWEGERYAGAVPGGELVVVETLTYSPLGDFLSRRGELGAAYGQYLTDEFYKHPSLDELKTRRKKIISDAHAGRLTPRPPIQFVGFQAWVLDRAQSSPGFATRLRTALREELPHPGSLIGRLHEEYSKTTLGSQSK